MDNDQPDGPKIGFDTADAAVNPSEYVETPARGAGTTMNATTDRTASIDSMSGKHGTVRSRQSVAHESDFGGVSDYAPPPSADPSLRAHLAHTVKHGKNFTAIQKEAVRVTRSQSMDPDRSLSNTMRQHSATLGQHLVSRQMLTGLPRQSGELSVQDRLSECRRLRRELHIESGNLSWWRVVYFAFSLRLTMYFTELFLAWERSGLWRHRIDELQGIHGAHVGVYFQKMRFVMLLNVLLTLIWIGFVIIPQAVIFGFEEGPHQIVGGDTTLEKGGSDNFVGLFTGGGILNTSFYFYGAYTQKGVATAEPSSPWDAVGQAKDTRLSDEYDVVTAYISVTLASFLISYIAIFHQIHRAAEDGIESSKSTRGEWVPVTALTSYDHSITAERSITVMLRSFRMSFKEFVEKLTIDTSASFTELVIRRGFIWVFVLVTLGGTIYGIFLTVVNYSSSSSETERLYPAIVLTVANGLIPWVFEIVAAFEKYSNENVVIQVTLLRSAILRFVGLLVFFFTSVGLKDQFQCWENYVGQQMYSAFVVGFSVEVFTCLFWDMNTTLAFRHVSCSHAVLAEEAYFDTIGKSLTLLYSQCLVWLGCGFCPMLPVLGVFRNLIMFYVQKWSTMKWCSPRLTVKQFDSGASLPLVIWYLLLAGIVVSCGSMMYLFPNYATSGVKMSERWQDNFVGLNLERELDLSNTTNVCPTEPLARVVSSCQICADASLPASSTAEDRVCWRPSWVDLNGDTNFHFKANTSYGGRFSDGVYVTVAELCNACPRGCGPFRSHVNAYDVLIQSSASWDGDFMDVVAFAGTPAFTFLLAAGLLSWMMLVKAQSAARRELNHKLAYQLELQLHDKSHLVDMLKSARGGPSSPVGIGGSAFHM